MPQPFDPVLKTLSELAPADWLPLAGRRRRRVTLLDSDLGTLVSGAGDRIFRVHDTPEYLLHLEFETGHFRADLPLRLRLYNSVFEHRHQCVAVSVVVLLRPEADSPQWNGSLRRSLPREPRPRSTLEYKVVRVWNLPAEQLLAGGVGTLPLAPISNVAEGEVQSVIRRMRERLSGPRPPRRANDLWAAAYLLLGLRYSAEFAQAIFQEVLGMEESATYQAIVRRSRAEEARRLLLLAGSNKFGAPDPATRARIEQWEDLEQLEQLVAVGVATATSWQDLLPPPPPRPRTRHRREN
jgi:predicted transposase YdaD